MNDKCIKKINQKGMPHELCPEVAKMLNPLIMKNTVLPGNPSRGM
jgi:hypothetical protein